MATKAQTYLARYLPHAAVTTFVIGVGPMWFALAITDSMLGSLVISLGTSLGLCAVGSALWQRMDGSSDLVFDDLLLWRYWRKLRSMKNSVKLAEEFKRSLQPDTGISRAHQEKLLKKIAGALENGDPYTDGHSRRVGRLSYMVAKTMRLDPKFCKKLLLAGLLHDVGKLDVPPDLLNKPGRLSNSEFKVIQTHSEVGAHLVAVLGDPELEAIIRGHHERLDGTGYPDNLIGDQIHIGARIIAVVDTFDAITSKRPYRGAQKHRVAMEIIERDAGTKLDPTVVRAFRSYYSGRGSAKRWAFFTNGLRHGPEFLLGGASGSFGTIANAALVGGATVVMAASPAFVDRIPARSVHAQATSDESRAGSSQDSDDAFDESGPVTRTDYAAGIANGNGNQDSATKRAQKARGQGRGLDSDKSKGSSAEHRGPSNNSKATVPGRAKGHSDAPGQSKATTAAAGSNNGEDNKAAAAGNAAEEVGDKVKDAVEAAAGAIGLDDSTEDESSPGNSNGKGSEKKD